MKPYVTVLINTINEVPERLIATINSFKIQQKYFKLQILISTISNDVSINIANKMNCDVVVSDKKGIYEQLNNAVKYIKGDWWCYSSGHDISETNKLLNEVYKCINGNKLVCYSNYFTVNPDTNEKTEKIFYKYDYERHLKGNFINDCSVINTNLSKKYLPFRNDLWGNDSHYDFWLRIYEGEGNIFAWNKTPSWNYILFNDSKHLVRLKSEKELMEYANIRQEMLNSRKPVITIGLPTYNSKIVWLAIESLCNQQTNIDWELIICEDEIGANGEYYYNQWRDRLKESGCVRFKYVEVSEKTTTSDRMALSLKWRVIVANSSASSLGLLLQASDCYSEPHRIQTAYDKFTAGYDWINSRYGIFYHIYEKKTILFDMNTVETYTGLNMAMGMDIARQLPNEIKFSSIDHWLFTSMMKIKPAYNVYIDLSNNWKRGVDTDGENIISVRRKNNYAETKPPFLRTDIKINDCLPKDVLKLLDEKTKPVKNNFITQCFVSHSVWFFEKKLFEKYKFSNPRNSEKEQFKIDINKPLLIFGCYNKFDLAIAMNHKSDVVILWAGSDSMSYNHFNMKLFKNKKNIFHISGSKFISEDLEACGLKYKYYPISLCNHSELKSCELGNKIYVYLGSEKNREFYGGSIVEELIKHYGQSKFIVTYKNTFAKKELYKMYKKCFIGLRLVQHDGLSETIAELGLMGRNVVHNGDTPNSLKYTDVESIIKLIDKESKRIGTEQKKLSNEMRKYLDVPNEWLNINTYKYGK